LRILHVDTGRELRGGQRQALLLLKALRAEHECLLLARRNSPLWHEAANLNIEVQSATLPALFHAAGKFDLLHAHDARAHTLACVAVRIPLIVSRRVAFPVRASAFSRWKYRKPVRFIAVSRYVQQQLIDAGVSGNRIDLVYDGVELSPNPPAWNPAGPPVALALSDPQKGRDLIERASRILGRPVIFSNDLEHSLQGASMFVYISRTEGVGSAALLAMSLGVPVIASRVGGLPEVIEDGSSGLLVENRPEQIAEAIRRLSSESSLACSLLRNARAIAAERFSAGRMIAGTLAAYRRALVE
jgi:glycosyltransferase involved in cell wall biosynthesis